MNGWVNLSQGTSRSTSGFVPTTEPAFLRECSPSGCFKEARRSKTSVLNCSRTAGGTHLFGGSKQCCSSASRDIQDPLSRREIRACHQPAAKRREDIRANPPVGRSNPAVQTGDLLFANVCIISHRAFPFTALRVSSFKRVLFFCRWHRTTIWCELVRTS